MFVLLTFLFVLLNEAFIIVLGNPKVNLDSFSPALSFDVMNGKLASDYNGYPEYYKGDFNGDGFDDLLLTDYSIQTLYIMYSKESLTNIVLSRSDWNSANGLYFNLHFQFPSANSIAFIGDFNHDGFNDVMVSDPFCSPMGRNQAGCSSIILGKATGYSTTDITAAACLTIVGAASEHSGVSLAPAGDINNDGFDDVILGTDSLKTYFIYGKANNQNIDLASLTPSEGFSVTRSIFWTGLGSPAGDFNQDGFDDILFSYRCNDWGPPMCATTYLMFGQTSFPSSISLDATSDQPGIYFTSSTGISDMVPAAAGDVNNDGFDDIIISAYVPPQGSTYIIYGKPLATSSITVKDLAALPASDGVTITSVGSNPYLGSIGDVNFDGYGDICFQIDKLEYVLYGGAALPATINLNSLTASDGMTINVGSDYGYEYGAFRVVGDLDQDDQTEFSLEKYDTTSGFFHTYFYRFVSSDGSRPSRSPALAPTKSPTEMIVETDSSDPALLSTGGIIGIAIGGAAALALVIAYYLARGVVTSPTIPTATAIASQGGNKYYASVQLKEASDIEMNQINVVAIVSDAEMRF